MATKKKQGGAELILLAIGIIFIPLVATFGLWHYMKLKNRYLKNKGVRRVVDIWNLGVPFYSFASMLVLAYLLIPLVATSISEALAFAIYPFVIYTGIKLAQRSASYYFGAAIIPETGTVVFPEDMAGYGIGDYIKLKFIRNLARMDEIELSDIEKISRQSGKRLYLHGPFGSRSISFTNKQKRDECISAIQSVSKKRSLLLNELEDYD